MRLGIVGPCASGKSTISRKLRELGEDAYSVGQEHSGVPDLWGRRAPDFLVYLGVEIETIRERRRNPKWPEWILELQLERLQSARDNADLNVRTDELSPDEIVERIVREIRSVEAGYEDVTGR